MRRGSLAKIAQLRHRRLHAEGHLVLGDARGNLGVVHDAVVHAVERLAPRR